MTELPSITYLCRTCGVPVTPALRATVAPPRAIDGEDMIPAGYVGDTDMTPITGAAWLAEMDLPASWPMLSPEDVLGQPINRLGQPRASFEGCCGPSGFEYLNIACVNGHPVAIEQSECYLPHVSVLDPERVVRTAGPPAAHRVVFLSRHQPHRTFEDFCAELHQAFEFDAWYGADLPLILGKWGCRSPERIDLVWLQSARAGANGLPMRDIEAAFAEQAQFVRLLLA